ncbi:MAG: TonB-dependent receptor [Chitinophagaceae bacterium]|jgi:TonB-dependent SusC/RagA subfamily outer membrane receptor
MRAIFTFALLIGMWQTTTAQTTQDISSGAVRTIYDLLRTVPGIEISLTTSLKAQPQIYVRDTRNMKGKVPATIVLDKAIYEGDVSLINAMDVSTITVLKDEAAAAAYGSRGFGGVVVITTKDGKSYVPPTVNRFETSAFQYFILKQQPIKVIGLDGKAIASGRIDRETDTSIVIKKREILKKNIERVEMIVQ